MAAGRRLETHGLNVLQYLHHCTQNRVNYKTVLSDMEEQNFDSAKNWMKNKRRQCDDFYLVDGEDDYNHDDTR